MAPSTSGGARIRTLLLALLLSSTCLSAQPEDLEINDLVGVWKMCFEPGLEDLYEPSEGYLAFSPDGTYIEIRWDCCADHLEGEASTYSVDGEVVRLKNVRNDGSEYSRSFRLVRSVSVVLFDDLHGEPLVMDALQIGKDLNYSFCRVYPNGSLDSGKTSSVSSTNR